MKKLILIIALACLVKANADVWITPPSDICKNNGGEVNSEQQCKASFKEAKNICEVIGGRLGSIDEFKNVLNSCGSSLINISKELSDEDIDNMVNNMFNTSKKSCYQSKGFAFSKYWSSKLFYIIDFKTELFHPVVKDSYVRCIPTEKKSQKSNTNRDKEFVIIGAGVKLRENISAKSKKIYLSSFGMIGSFITKSLNEKGDTYYKLKIKEKEGWINQKYLYPFDEQKRDEIFLKIATEKFKNSKSDFITK